MVEGWGFRQIKVCKNQNMCFVFVFPCALWWRGENGKIKTGHKATSDLPVRADDIAAEVVLPAILWFPGFLEKQFKA